MERSLLTILLTLGLFAGMILLLEWGRRLGRRAQKENEGARAGLGAVEGAVFGLMGLLIAFTFSGAASRFDARRELVVQEANSVGTAWLRLDLLPTTAQPALRDLFRRYLDLRLGAYEKLPDIAAARDDMNKAAAVQNEIWKLATAACQAAPGPLTVQIIPALNEMFDVSASHLAASRVHPPIIIFVMLGVLALLSSLLAGFAMAGGQSHQWIHTLIFTLILSTTVYVILDLEFPRVGLIRIDTDEMLRDVRRSMD